MCPLCVAGAAIGLSIARYYGVDDTVVGVWLGALAISSAIWAMRVSNNRIKKQYVPAQSFAIAVIVALAMVLPFYYAGFFRGMPNMPDSVLGVNKVLLGLVVGSILTYAGVPASNAAKRRGVHVPYQATILTLSLLMVFSVLFWYLSVIHAI